MFAIGIGVTTEFNYDHEIQLCNSVMNNVSIY